ncbi:winged helix-turn-helix domain-containing protein [Paenibacillus albidus]|nr:winged helix-turn-helix domain-containing protein [Paenibacillus albidus]
MDMMIWCGYAVEGESGMRSTCCHTQAEEWAGALHILDVDKRLAKLLLHLYSKIGLQSGDQAINDFITLPAAKKEIAAMIGTTPETLSRKLNCFEENRIIEVCKRNIHIRNIRALNDIAEVGLDEVINNGVEAVCT